MEKTYRTSYEERLLLDMDYAPGGAIVYYGDGDEEFIHVNQYILDLTECGTVEEFLELTHGSFRGFVVEDDLEVVQQSVHEQIELRHVLSHIYYRVRCASGRIVVVDDYGRVSMSKRGERPVYHAYIVEMNDTGAMDWLTGLPGMSRFHDLARAGAKAMRDRGEQPVIVALDLTGMKAFNTRHGREKGTKLISICAKVLANQFGRESCSRFAEDHFYAFAPAEGIEERIGTLFEEFENMNHDMKLPLRVGIYACEESDDIIGVGLDRAKFACDYDRSTWQSHMTWFTKEMHDATHFRMYILDNLDRAIEERWVRPYYQVIVRSSSGNVCREEALARWVDPELGELAPPVFIPVLEEAGVMQRLDTYMVECVLRDMAVRRECGLPLQPVSVNFSLRGVTRLDIAKEVSERCDAYGIDHSLLCIEFTEATASFDPVHLKDQLTNLHAAGFEVWMDDFGSGHSSLAIMQEFDFDLIKLDMGFFDHGNSQRSRVVIEGVVHMAGRLGLKTLAEGVEDEEQARFLERIGCDMLQGYYFMPPLPLEDIIEDSIEDVDLTFEEPSEQVYWDDISLLDLNELTEYDDVERIGKTPVTRMPVAVIERGDEDWYVLRANDAYVELAGTSQELPASGIGLGARPISPRPKKGFTLAVQRSDSSGTWEYASEDFGFGLEYQFYVHPFVYSGSKRAYILVGAPSMLGSALGSYGDVPVAYAILKIMLDDNRTKVLDAEYVYANPVYHSWVGAEEGTLTGTSFRSSIENASNLWVPYCHRAVVGKEFVHDVVFSPEIDHWVSFNLVPSPVEGCCVFAFTIVDDERRERDEIIMGRDTSDLIIDVADALNGELGYDDAMDRLLKIVSRAIHPDRLYVFERYEYTSDDAFEWCAPGITPLKDLMQNVDNQAFATWERLLRQGSVVFIPDVEELRDVDEPLYQQLSSLGITHMLAVPFISEGNLLGFLGADNYQLDECLDTRRLLETVASFISARIANRRLLDQLEWVSRHDGLTGLLNRWGIDHVVGKYLRDHAGEPYVLVLMDVDDFKTVNDMHGHDVGDAALTTLAKIVTDTFPASTILGRNGGDEFLALVCGDDAAHIDEILDPLVSQKLGCVHNGTWYPLSMSIGYASYPDQVEDLKEAYTRADEALYAVKLDGKSGYQGYTPDIATKYRSQLGFSPRDIAGNLPGAIVVHRPNCGDILFANDDAIALFECRDLADFMEHVDGTFDGLIHPDDRARVREELTEQTNMGYLGSTDYVDFRIVTKFGNVRQVLNNGRGVEVEGIGKVYYELLIRRDGHSLS